MSIIDDINSASTKAELKAVYQSSIKPIKALQEEVESLAADYLVVSTALATAKEDLRNALVDGLSVDADGLSVDDIVDALRSQLGKITENEMEL